MNSMSLLVLVGLQIITVQPFLHESHSSKVLLVLVIHLHLILQGLSQKISLVSTHCLLLLFLLRESDDVTISHISVMFGLNFAHVNTLPLFFN